MRLQTQVAPEIQKRLLLSRVEAESLKERDILCPTCGFRIQRVFSDATGHLSVKCQKCKNVHILNLAYFRRIRRNGYGSDTTTFDGRSISWIHQEPFIISGTGADGFYYTYDCGPITQAGSYRFNTTFRSTNFPNTTRSFSTVFTFSAN